MLAKENTNPPHLKPILSTLAFIFPKKTVFANKYCFSFPIQWDCCKYSMAHDSGEAEKVYQKSVVFP